MGGACGTYGGEEKCVQGFGGETRGKETTWKTGLGWKIILKLIFKTWNEEAWTGLIWLKIGTCGGHFETR